MATLVSTEVAALYWLMLQRPKERIQSFNEDQIIKARRKIYNLARDGQLTKHGGEERGQALWSLSEVHRVCVTQK